MGKKNKVWFEFNPFEATKKPPPKGTARKEVLESIAYAVQDYILEKVSEGSSPVKGGRWKRSLSPEYRAKKQAQGGSSFADMELDGDMLDALEVEVRGNRVWVGISDREQAQKADGHNNHSGLSKLPPREFIPNPNDKSAGFRPELMREIAQLIEEAESGET